MDNISQLLLYVPGIIIFLVGSGQVRQWLWMRRSGVCADACVTDCRHVVKKDRKEREIYNYYNVTVEYVNGKTGHKERQAVKTPTEYAKGQRVRVLKERRSGRLVLDEQRENVLFHPLVMMVGGALLILLALAENRGREIEAMLCLSIVLVGAGVSLLADYISLKRKNLQVIEAEITDIYSRQISKETKIIKGSKYTYYPIVRYVLDGQENIRRCNINSGRQDSFKTGEHMKLYYDPRSKTVRENHARPAAAAVGLVLTVIGTAAGASILSVIL